MRWDAIAGGWGGRTDDPPYGRLAPGERGYAGFLHECRLIGGCRRRLYRRYRRFEFGGRLNGGSVCRYIYIYISTTPHTPELNERWGVEHTNAVNLSCTSLNCSSWVL